MDNYCFREQLFLGFHWGTGGNVCISRKWSSLSFRGRGGDGTQSVFLGVYSDIPLDLVLYIGLLGYVNKGAFGWK